MLEQEADILKQEYDNEAKKKKTKNKDKYERSRSKEKPSTSSSSHARLTRVVSAVKCELIHYLYAVNLQHIGH